MHHIDAEAAEEMIEKADKRRSEYYNYYSYKTWGAAATYHLCVDSSSLGVEETVRFIDCLLYTSLDRYGRIYVSSRGDYYGTGSNVFVIDTQTDCVTGSLGIAASEMCLSGDSIYMTSVEWSYVTESNTITYALYDVKQNKMVSRNFITDGTEAEIAIPYGVTVNPVSYTHLLC